MKSYEIISHIIDDTIAHALDHNRYALFYFQNYLRYESPLPCTTTPGLKTLRHKARTDNQYIFHAGTWHSEDDRIGYYKHGYNRNGGYTRTSDINFIDHSFEPINYALDQELWTSIPVCAGSGVPHVIIHSERDSLDLEQTGLQNIYWFSHAYLCSEFYFRHYNKLRMVWDWRSRPILYPWLCVNRLLRQHRTDFLELLDLDKGCYSLLNPDPNGLVYSGPVQPNSFDEHENHSAEIKVDNLTPWNASFLHVVSETVWQDKIHFTEKIFKPIVLHQPFVVLQAPGSLQYLRDYGFKTFGDWWDESYDNIKDPQERMQAIADIVNWIPSQNLERIRMEMASVLEHNFRHFYENIPAICLDELRDNLTNLSV